MVKTGNKIAAKIVYYMFHYVEKSYFHFCFKYLYVQYVRISLLVIQISSKR